MARSSNVSKRIYRDHLALYRYINDASIFLEIVRPHLEAEIRLFSSAPAKETTNFRVPKKGKKILSRRKNKDIINTIKFHADRGLFETFIVTMVSRMETHLQDCLRHAIEAFSEKISVLAGEKPHIPLELVLCAGDKQQILASFIDLKCKDLMFQSPQDYIKRFEKVLSVELPDDLVKKYIEIKATRDVLIHNQGITNELYLRKAKELARASVGEVIPIDRSYFIYVVETLKKLAGAIVHRVEQAYA